VWLTAGLLPYIYVLSLVLTYDSALRGISWAAKGGRPRWRAWLALMARLHFRHREVAAFNWNRARRLVEAPTLSGARAVASSATSAARRSKPSRTKRSASGGMRARVELTTRDVAGTEASSSPASTRYAFSKRVRPPGIVSTAAFIGEDLLTMSGSFRGLPEESGSELRVSVDGQSWYAWRRTISGWCFAIGAAGPPPDQWEFDGPEPPQGFPGRDPIWGERSLADRNRNWQPVLLDVKP
jgi:hypothetical protein